MPPPTGKTAVVVGNGPSADAIPSQFWLDIQADPACLLIGTNRALVMKCMQDMRINVMVIRDHCRNLFGQADYGSHYHKEYWEKFVGWKIGPAHQRYTACDEFLRFEAGWQHERKLDANYEAAVLLQNTVVLMAANWAWQQGCHDIILIGVDYGRGPDGSGHAKLISPWDKFMPATDAAQYGQPVPANLELAFHQANLEIIKEGGTLLNCSPYTRLASVALHPLAEQIRQEATQRTGDFGDRVPAVAEPPIGDRMAANMPRTVSGSELICGPQPPAPAGETEEPQSPPKRLRRKKSHHKKGEKQARKEKAKRRRVIYADEQATAGARQKALMLGVDVEDVVPFARGKRVGALDVTRYYKANHPALAATPVE